MAAPAFRTRVASLGDTPTAAATASPRRRTLCDLPRGVCAIIVHVDVTDDATSDGNHLAHRRMRDLGFVPGATLRVVGRSSFRGPIAVEVGGSRFGIRRSEAACIHVRYLA